MLLCNFDPPGWECKTCKVSLFIYAYRFKYFMLYCYKCLAKARRFEVVRAIYFPILHMFVSVVYKEIAYFKNTSQFPTVL